MDAWSASLVLLAATIGLNALRVMTFGGDIPPIDDDTYQMLAIAGTAVGIVWIGHAHYTDVLGRYLVWRRL